LTAVAVKYKELQDLGVQVLAMSTDSRFSHKIWQEEELSKMVPGGVPFPMLSDAGGRIGEVYGVYDEEAGVDIRGRFLIDPEGIIQAMEVMTPPVGRNFAELLRQIQAFQHVRATGEATPAGWTPGKMTLTPSPDLVGKVWKVWKPEMAYNK
jgi:alkyl hydroperoxide reductase subunit AhpC